MWDTAINMFIVGCIACGIMLTILGLTVSIRAFFLWLFSDRKKRVESVKNPEKKQKNGLEI